MRILTIGIKELDKTKFHPCDSSGTEINKPPFGTCLWGSTMIKFPGGYVGSDWVRFTEFDYTNKYFTYGISYTLKKNARIIEIDGFDDYKKILQVYPYKESHSGETQIDFYKLSQYYDAFHLTYKAFWELRLPFLCSDELHDFFYKYHNANFYAYDAESWILFNLECINEGSILNHNNVRYCEYEE